MPFCIQAGDVEGFDAFDGDGVREFGDFFFGVYAFHGDPAAAVFQQVCRPVDEVGEFGESAAGDDVGLEVLNGFDAAVDDVDVGESEFDDGLLQEGGFFGVGVQEGDVEVGTADGGGNAGLSAAGADIQHGVRTLEVGEQGQAVEQVVADHLRFVAQGGEVVGLVPLFEQVGIGEQPGLLFCG